MTKIAPSMLSADFLHLSNDVEMVNEHADIFHLDIMDGIFVPNISYGFPVVEAIAKRATKTMDAHLMIAEPEKYIERFAKVGVGMISFHLDAAQKRGIAPDKILKDIHSYGVKAGIAINPNIPCEELFPYLDQMDFVLIMSVFAGFGGQKFIEETYSRIETVKAEIDRRGLDCEIEVDGGVSPKNASKLVESGASILVAGSSVFKADNPAEAIAAMRI